MNLKPATGQEAVTALPRRHRWAGYLLGFGMGGFFDGILLHQILQWHHLLSGVGTGAFGDLRVQVMADGLFHALMYVVAAAGLWSLYRSRGGQAPPRRQLLASFWLGFGAWHVIDAVVSHWITGIHRIRMDVSNPLVWDLAWLLLFGLLPLAAGLILRRGGGPPPGGTPSGGTPPGRGGAATGMAALLAIAVGAAALLNLYPLARPPQDTAVVVLRPGVSASRMLTALDATPARIVWADAAGGVWVLADTPALALLSLYGAGAMYVSGATAPSGCSAWLIAPGQAQRRAAVPAAITHPALVRPG